MANDILPITEAEVVLYQPDDNIKLDVRISNDTVWLTRQQMATLFGRDVKTIGKHINNALREELAFPVVAKFATTASDGKMYQTEHYSLDMILSVGYRVHSPQGILFRAWANSVLKQYLLNGYSVNHQLIALQQHVDDRLLRIEDRLQQNEEKSSLPRPYTSATTRRTDAKPNAISSQCLNIAEVRRKKTIVNSSQPAACGMPIRSLPISSVQPKNMSSS